MSGGLAVGQGYIFFQNLYPVFDLSSGFFCNVFSDAAGSFAYYRQYEKNKCCRKCRDRNQPEYFVFQKHVVIRDGMARLS
jgi:hypothetical protein